MPNDSSTYTVTEMKWVYLGDDDENETYLIKMTDKLKVEVIDDKVAFPPRVYGKSTRIPDDQ